jgi:hypothetical protein
MTGSEGDHFGGKKGLRFEISKVWRPEEILTINPRGTHVSGFSALED